MKQFLTVLKFELNNYFKNKSFLTTTLLLMVLMLGIVIVPTLIPGFLDKEESRGNEAAVETDSYDSGTYDEDLPILGIYMEPGAIGDPEGLLSRMSAQWVVFDSAEELKKVVKENQAEAGFVVKNSSEAVYVVNNLGMYDTYSQEFADAMSLYQKQEYLMEKGLTQEEAAAAEYMPVSLSEEILGKNSVRNYAYTYVLIFVLYFLILFYGQMIATSVTTEKSNRAIEILVTSVNSNSLIFGKVLAGAIAGIMQLVLILGSGFAAYGALRDAWGGMLDFLFQIPAKDFAAFAVFGILSYLLYAFIYGMLGALVSRTEDISKSATPVTLIYVASFLAAVFGLQDCESLLVKVTSFIPFTSGNAMFIRISMGEVAVWEILVSGGILVVSCVAVGVLAAKLFRFGTLHYGNPVKIRTALKHMGQE